MSRLTFALTEKDQVVQAVTDFERDLIALCNRLVDDGRLGGQHYTQIDYMVDQIQMHCRIATIGLPIVLRDAS